MKCLSCGKVISDFALKCPYCNCGIADSTSTSISPYQTKKRSGSVCKYIFYAVVILVTFVAIRYGIGFQYLGAIIFKPALMIFPAIFGLFVILRERMFSRIKRKYIIVIVAILSLIYSGAREFGVYIVFGYYAVERYIVFICINAILDAISILAIIMSIIMISKSLRIDH